MKHARADYDRFQDPACLIPEDEPVFLIRGQDILAPDTLRAYANAARQAGRKDIADLTFDHANRMVEWQRARKNKLPDLPLAAEPVTTGTEGR